MASSRARDPRARTLDRCSTWNRRRSPHPADPRPRPPHDPRSAGGRPGRAQRRSSQAPTRRGSRCSTWNTAAQVPEPEGRGGEGRHGEDSSSTSAMLHVRHVGPEPASRGLRRRDSARHGRPSAAGFRLGRGCRRSATFHVQHVGQGPDLEGRLDGEPSRGTREPTFGPQASPRTRQADQRRCSTWNGRPGTGSRGPGCRRTEPKDGRRPSVRRPRQERTRQRTGDPRRGTPQPGTRSRASSRRTGRHPGTRSSVRSRPEHQRSSTGSSRPAPGSRTPGAGNRGSAQRVSFRPHATAGTLPAAQRRHPAWNTAARGPRFGPQPPRTSAIVDGEQSARAGISRAGGRHTGSRHPRRQSPRRRPPRLGGPRRRPRLRHAGDS